MQGEGRIATSSRGFSVPFFQFYKKVGFSSRRYKQVCRMTEVFYCSNVSGAGRWRRM